MSRAQLGRFPASLPILLPLLFLAAFFFFPLINILRLSVSSDAIERLISGDYFASVAWFTIWQAVLSTVLTLIAGLPAAYVFSRFDFAGKRFLRALITVPFVLPTVVVAAAFRALLGSTSPVIQLISAFGSESLADFNFDQTIYLILIAHIYYNIAVVVRLVGGFWSNLDPALTEAANLLGARPSRAFLEITLPLLWPALSAAAVLIFLFTFTSFGVILILGGPAFSTLETEIYRQYVTFLRPDVAGVLSLLQIIFTFGLMWLYAHWQRSRVVPLELRPEKSTVRRPSSTQEKGIVFVLIGGFTVFMSSPLLALVWRSLVNRQGHLSIAYYQALPVLRRGSITFISPLEAVSNSLGYALLTVLGAAALGLMTSAVLGRRSRWRGWLDPVFMLPLGVSAVTLGFGFVVTFDRLRTSPILVLIAHMLVALPFVVRSLLPVVQSIRPNLREAAAVLGASPTRVWREVDLPIVARALLVGAVFAFTISLGEFGATSFIVRPNSGYLTLPIAIQRYLAQPGELNFGQSMAMSVILMSICLVGFLAIERFRYADVGEF